EGFRVLGIAGKPQPRGCTAVAKGDEGDLVFVGFAAFHDPPKQSARAALRDLAGMGVTIKVLTGDNELVAQHVCRELELPVAGVLTGADIHAMDDAALAARVEGTTLFCRVTPAQKSRV